MNLAKSGNQNDQPHLLCSARIAGLPMILLLPSISGPELNALKLGREAEYKGKGPAWSGHKRGSLSMSRWYCLHASWQASCNQEFARNVAFGSPLCLQCTCMEVSHSLASLGCPELQLLVISTPWEFSSRPASDLLESSRGLCLRAPTLPPRCRSAGRGANPPGVGSPTSPLLGGLAPLGRCNPLCLLRVEAELASGTVDNVPSSGKCRRGLTIAFREDTHPSGLGSLKVGAAPPVCGSPARVASMFWRTSKMTSLAGASLGSADRMWDRSRSSGSGSSRA